MHGGNVQEIRKDSGGRRGGTRDVLSARGQRSGHQMRGIGAQVHGWGQ